MAATPVFRLNYVRRLMHDGHYMLPAEFLVLVGFLFAPPLLLALVAQSIAFARRGIFARGLVGRAAAGYAITVVGSLVVGAAVHQFAPRSLGPFLRVREVALGGQFWPVMPLTFLAVAIAATAATFWVLRSVKAGA
jgi:hypothetical protein